MVSSTEVVREVAPARRRVASAEAIEAAYRAQAPRLRRLAAAVAGAATEVTVDPTLLGTLRRLPERQRDCVVLRYYGDQSYAEIARVMGIEVGTVGALLSKAHAALRAEIEREELR
jgi:DNA-directed RNA polymerase specialized sigma24 family protein